MQNKFYEFKEPYYALIAAQSPESALEIYVEDICETCTEENAPVEITEEAARAAWDARGNKDECPEGFDVWLSEENECAILIDSCLY